jgi:hypothetical protein
MDFLDPQKLRRHDRMILVGYVFMATAIAIATMILVLLASGFWFNKKGEVIQNGLVFVSSTPNPANVYFNDVRNKSQTNSRIVLQEGSYDMRLERDGYRNWERRIQVRGNSVVHFDYPFLIPNKLETTTIKTLESAPAFTSQSPDRRWLIVPRPGEIRQFELFDLKNPKKVASTNITVPEGVLAATGEPQSWQPLEWSNDNRHLLLRYHSGGMSEYVMLDRADPTQTVNLTKALGTNPTDLQLIDKKYDRYYLYDATTQALSRATLGDPTPVPVLERVLTYKSYGTNIVLYAAAASPESDNNVTIKILQNDKTYTIRQFPAGSDYLVNLAEYDGDMYVAVAAGNGDRGYIYRNPIRQINDRNLGAASPQRILRVKSPTYLSFSANTRFIMAENATSFAVYDAEDDHSYTYEAADKLEAPQPHATWMDGERLVYTSNGKVVMLDYDNRNRQELVAGLPAYLPIFDSSYRTLYTFVTANDAPGKVTLTQTWLRTQQDR